MKDVKPLTKAEEEVMQVLWLLQKTNVAQILEEFPAPKPAYNTVSTIIRILENKGFVSHEKQGKGYLYFPLISKADYSNATLTTLMDGYFQGSFKNMVSFFVQKNDMDIKEFEAIMHEIKSNKK